MVHSLEVYEDDAISDLHIALQKAEYVLADESVTFEKKKGLHF